MVSHALSDEFRYRILKVLEENPQTSQRALARALGISLGKANYCLRGFIEKGLLKVRNFKNNDNKRAYFYYLTPRGLEEKTKVTVRFLRLKMHEYETLAAEMNRFRITSAPDHEVSVSIGRQRKRESRMVRR